MSFVVISGTYPTREQLSGDAKYLVVDSKHQPAHPDQSQHETCPFAHGHHAPTKVLKYTPTQEDERMRQALKLLKPTRADFRIADYSLSFNWADISAEYLRLLKSQNSQPDLPSRSNTDDLTWYAVVFRSKRRKDCNNLDLFTADKNAYEEAYKQTNGSLLVYWYTGLDEDHNCLATCVWTSRDIARSVNSLPAHREAASLSAGSYVHYHIDRYRIQWLPKDNHLKVTPW